MMKTVSGLQDQLSKTDESLAEVRAGLTVVVDDIAVNNTEMRTLLVQEIQTNIQEKISQVNILVQEYEIKSKDVGQMMKDDHRKEMASIEGQLNTIYQEYEKMEKSLEEYRNSYSNDWVELSKASKNNEDNIAKTDEKMNAIMEQANSLMINDARQDETLGKLENRMKSTEEKHQSLEEADVFLQEAQRQITEKSSALETLMKTRQETFSSGLEAVETSLGEVGGRVEALENISDQIQAKLAAEIEKLDKVDADFSSQFSDFQKETRTNLDNLRAMEDTLDSGLRDMLDTSSSFTNNMETVEEEIKRMRESLVELDFKSEKAVVVETLTAQVDRMTEDKARQEENTAAELERLAGKIAELNEAASARLTDVDIYSQGVNTKIEELENTVEDRLAQLADKTRAEVDSRLVSVEGRVEDNAEENKLIVQKFGNQQDSIDKIFTDISAHSSVLEEMLVLKETQMARLDGLGSEVQEKMVQLAGEVNNLDVKMTNNVTALEKQQSQDKDNLLTLTIEMYSVFDNYTLLIKSDSEVGHHQPQLLGVYRMVDTYNDRPVYKQDQGENYVYYSSAGQCWLVGCLVGHRYSWLRNSSQAAPLCRYPSLLFSGWQVRTDTGDWEEVEQDSITFHNIKDVDKIKEIIRDIKS